MSGSGDMWEDAFRLAFFIVPDRASACGIVGKAMEKLKVQRSREKRRVYWRGRNTGLKTRKISRSEEDTLQWLVYLESEAYEREQENSNRQTETDMVIRYIKHLVQMTVGISSFYVNVGLNRLLHSYSTPEVQQVYEFVTEHYPASEEYRKVKGRLMNQLATRFDSFLEIRTSQYRELRFEPDDNQESWLKLVEECLDHFIPWSSKEACLRGSTDFPAGNREAGIPHAGFHNHVDSIETHRCHLFMHPSCYGWLTSKLRLDSPHKRLAVPRFLLKNHSNGRGTHSNSPGRETAPLTKAEMEVLKDRIACVQARPQTIALQPLKIVAHGVPCARLNPLLDESREFVIPNGTRLLEIRRDVAEDDLLLAAHWIDYTESGEIAGGEYAISLKGGRELLFKVIPADSASEQKDGAAVIVESRSASLSAVRFPDIRLWKGGWQSLPRYALVSVLSGLFVWLGVTANYRSRLEQEQHILQSSAQEPASQKAAVGSSPSSLAQPAAAVPQYFLPLQNPSLRGEDQTEEPVVTFAPGNSLVMLHLPVADDKQRFYRATLSSFVEETERLTENQLKPEKKGNAWFIEFALPSSAVTDNTHYLITMAASDRKNQSGIMARFLFKVRK